MQKISVSVLLIFFHVNRLLDCSGSQNTTKLLSLDRNMKTFKDYVFLRRKCIRVYYSCPSLSSHSQQRSPSLMWSQKFWRYYYECINLLLPLAKGNLSNGRNLLANRVALLERGCCTQSVAKKWGLQATRGKGVGTCVQVRTQSISFLWNCFNINFTYSHELKITRLQSTKSYCSR